MKSIDTYAYNVERAMRFLEEERAFRAAVPYLTLNPPEEYPAAKRPSRPARPKKTTSSKEPRP